MSKPGVCLVIGAGDGLGSAVARAFAVEGMSVCVTRRARNLDQAQALADSIIAEGGRAHACGADARSEEARQRDPDLYARLKKELLDRISAELASKPSPDIQ